MKQTGIATLALMLALNVALGTILGAGMKAYAADTYGLRVGGTEITSEQLTVNGTHGTATYDPETHTLTLNNYSYTGVGYDGSGEGGGIDYRGDADLLIILQGSNSITKSSDAKLNFSHGIYFNVDDHTLTISGDGSLEISFAEATSGIKKRNGIFCEPGAFVMESGSVVTKGGLANESAGIYAKDGITINGGTFTGTGNPTPADGYESRGIYIPYGGIIIINGSKEVFVTVNATESSGKVSPDVSPDVPPQPSTPDDGGYDPSDPSTPDDGGDVPSDPSTPSSSPDVTPKSEPVVIENGKITINTNNTSGDSGGNSSGSRAAIITNLTDEEKQSIKQLEINSDVQSLEWVKELPNLKELTVGENASVEELNVSGNTSITKIDTHGANVKSVNVSGCTNLVSLDCSSCGIEQINVAGCNALNVLNISNNSLLKFDAEDLASLMELICDSQIVYMQSIGQNFALGEHLNTASYVKSAAESDNVKNLKAFDASGNEIAANFNSATGTASFGAEPYKVTYDYDTGFNGVTMDVTVYKAEEPDTSTVGRVGSSGGCNSAFGMTAIFAGLLLIFRKIR